MKLRILGVVTMLVALLLVGVTLALSTSQTTRTGAEQPLVVAAAVSPDGPPTCCIQ